MLLHHLSPYINTKPFSIADSRDSEPWVCSNDLLRLARQPYFNPVRKLLRPSHQAASNAVFTELYQLVCAADSKSKAI